MNARSPEEAARAYIHGYMRPGAGEGGDMRRAGAALSAMGSGLAASRNGSNVTRNNTSSVQQHIGKVEVHTAATDADGIARSITPALKRQFVPQFNTGLTV